MATYTIFGDAAPPIDAPPYDPPDTDGVNVATYFQTLLSGTITAIKFYAGNVDDDANHHFVGLYTYPGMDLLSSATQNGVVTDDGWITVPLDEPVAIETGQYYGAVVYYPEGDYVKKEHFLSDGRYTTSTFFVEVNGGTYKYDTGLAQPTTAYNGTCYFIDVILDDGVPSEVEMDEEQLLEATRQAYDAYWYAHAGRRNGSKLKAWSNLDQDEIDALVIATQAIEAYIDALE